MQCYSVLFQKDFFFTILTILYGIKTEYEHKQIDFFNFGTYVKMTVFFNKTAIKAAFPFNRETKNISTNNLLHFVIYFCLVITHIRLYNL